MMPNRIPLMSRGDIMGYESKNYYGAESEPTAIDVSGSVDSISGQQTGNTMPWMMMVGLLIGVALVFKLLPSD